MPKTCRFSTSIFSRLGLDFGGFWAPKMEPSWLIWPQKTSVPALLKRLKLSVFQKWRLGGLQARFWRPQGSILEGLGTIFARFSHVLGHVVPRSSPSRSPFFLQQSSLVVMLLRLLDFSWTPAGFQLGSTLSASKGKCLNPNGCGGFRVAVSISVQCFWERH